MVISYSFGIIDFLHFGHIRLFQDAKHIGDKFIFGLIEDKSILQFHGNLVSSFQERLSVLKGVKYIDEIWSQSSFDPLSNLRKIHNLYPEAKIVLFVGSDRVFVPCEDYLKSIGGEIKIVEYYEKLSPQNILSSMLSKKDRSKEYYSNIISTKANTLFALKSRITKAKIEDLLIITLGDFVKDRENVFKLIAKTFNSNTIVVRSSSTSEDCFESSNAGHFDSVLNVNSSVKEEVYKAIETVAASYDKTSLNYYNEQILVQTQTKNVICSGVIFTRDVDSNLPYYLINYDDGNSTDSVTSGSGGKSVWILRRVAETNSPKKWRELFLAVKEIEGILKKIVLDIEFAITEDLSVVIFQVRPLAANYKFNVKSNDSLFYELYSKEKLAFKNIRNYRNYGDMILSDMAFWNPSEIIGVNPHYLDYSLYRDIITKRAWNDGLLSLGYSRVSDELMFKIGNKPYISVDYSFWALTPDSIDKSLKEKLLAYYKQKLLYDPSAHDKIEFEIVFSCYDFSTNNALKTLCGNNFSEEEISAFKASLFNLTDSIIAKYETILASDLQDLEELEKERIDIETEIEKRDDDVFLFLSSIYRLLSAIKRYGTPQFSRQARCAFISRSLCKSMVSEGYVSDIDMDCLLSSIKTVAADFERDFKLLSHNLISRTKFNKIYGHLRCGTYDIQSPRYSNLNFPTSYSLLKEDKVRTDKASDNIVSSISKSLSVLNFSSDSRTMLSFIKKALEEREHFKFIFTRSLSLVLDLLERIGAIMDFSTSDLSYLEIPDIYSAQYYSSISDLKEFWSTLIAKRKDFFETKSKIILPALISSVNDLEVIELSESRPNFVTSNKIKGDVVVLEDGISQDITGKIVVITKADPGYDWIFTKGIIGLITKYGGAASHMAIRCSEFLLPAAIGCGAKIFEYVVNSQQIELDCNNKKINRIY